MVKFFIALCAVVLLMGCATIKYDATTGSFAYQRFGNQQLVGLDIEKTVDGTTVHLGRQKSEREIAEVLLELSKNIDKVLEILNQIQKKVPALF